MDFDIRWLSLSGSSADRLDDVVAAEQRPAEPAPQDGRFEALLAAHLQWAQAARSAQPAGNESKVQVLETGRISRVQAMVHSQLQRIAGLEPVT